LIDESSPTAPDDYRYAPTSGSTRSRVASGIASVGVFIVPSSAE
jgi:hypothetical protein